MSVIYFPNKQLDTSFKTHQNIERLTKLSTRLNYIQNNIETQKFSKFEELDLKLNYLETKERELHTLQLKQFSQIKQQMTRIIQSIEEDRINYEASFLNRAQYISTLEFKLLEKFETESELRNEMQRRFLTFIDENFLILNSELSKEIRNRNESLQNLNYFIEIEIPKIMDELNGEIILREENDTEIFNKINQEFEKLNYFIKYEKISREETEEAFLEMIRSVIIKLQKDLENEKIEREKSEEMLLNLLEETLDKIEEISSDF